MGVGVLGGFGVLGVGFWGFGGVWVWSRVDGLRFVQAFPKACKGFIQVSML